MLLEVRRVWVIQHKPSGMFLTEELNWTKILSRAGRLHDSEEAWDTAKTNCKGDEFAISSFLEEIQ